ESDRLACLTGIGFTIAESFAAVSAARLIITGRQQHALYKAVSKMKTKYPNIEVNPIVNDFADEAATREFWKKLAEDGIFVDVLVLSAAKMWLPNTLLGLGYETFKDGLSVNLVAPYLWTSLFHEQRAVNPSRKLVLLNLATIAIHATQLSVPIPLYSLTKGAGTMMMQHIAMTVPSSEMQIITLEPGLHQPPRLGLSITTCLYAIVMESSAPPLPSPLTIMVPNSTSLTPSPVPTSSPTPTLSPAPVRYHEPPDEFVQDRITYVKRATITKKGFRLGSSHIWKYGLQYIRGSDKKEVYYCHECTAGKNKQELFVINGTSKVRNHLEQKHQIDPQSGIKKHSSTRKSVLDQQKSAAATNTFFWKDSMEKFKELLIRWIVYCHIAFFQLENRYFRELLFFLNPALLNHLPKAAKTIRSWVMDAFLSKKQRLREDLQRSRSRISISFDLWTSPNPYAILGVIAMWIDTTGKRRTTVLGIRRVYGEHTGENLGSVVLELLKEYDIGGDEIGYFMLDNASSNDTAVGFILKELCPWMDSKQRRHRRLRCLGHIVNLCCQAFLMGRNCEKYLAKLEKHYQRGDYVKVEELWKKFGCLGRLHNLVRYIRLTPQRREEFAAIIIGGDLSEFDGLELIQNNSTRWNSWFHSITRALNVRERLEIFSARHVPGKGSQGIANFKLDGQHWFELEKIELALKDFYAATLLSEGKKTSLADWFSTLDCLLREVSETKDHYHDIHTEDDNNFTWKYLQSCADAAWSKCAEYYSNQQLNWQNRFPEDTDLPPAYYAAQILDPYRKWAWFRQEWVLHGDEEKKRWFDNAQSAVKHLWETEYKGRHPVEMLPPPARKERAPDPAFDRQREHKRIRTDAPVSTTDLYEQYISTDRLHDDEAGYDDAIAYWLSRYDSQRDLARFALDLFAISPMSDECERLFSSAKLTIVDRRGRLKADIIEACECLRAWYGKPQVEDDSDSEDSENDNEWVDSYS
ncbi:hypothetical protein FOFC_13578, partial [Fusarium oxysporum]